MHPEEERLSTSKPNLTVEASTVPDPLTTKSTGSPKKPRWLLLILITLTLLLIVSGIVGVGIYQNNVNETNAHNAYLSSLSGNGTQTFVDPLSQESGSQWLTSTDGGACQFAGGAYHIQTQGYSFKRCHAKETYSDFAFEVQLTINQGGCGGMLFRDDENGRYYYFRICPSSGSYDIARYADYGIFEHLPSGNSSIINTGLGRPNKIAVRASGTAMTFYINEQQVTQVQDDGYTSGAVGLAANSYNGNSPDVAYTDARLWTL